MFFYKFFSNPIQKFKIINKGKKYLKKRYQFRRIFRKKFYMSKYFQQKNNSKINPYKKLRLINFDYNDYKIYTKKKQVLFFESCFNNKKIYIPKKYSFSHFKFLYVINYFNYYTNF